MDGGRVLRTERSGAVATITLDRPDRGNALTEQLKTELLDAVTAAGADSEVRAVESLYMEASKP